MGLSDVCWFRKERKICELFEDSFREFMIRILFLEFL